MNRARASIRNHEGISVDEGRRLNISVTLPILIVIRKTASGYAEFVSQTGVSPLPLFTLVGVTLWLLWRGVRFPPVEADPVVEADGSGALLAPSRAQHEARIAERV